MAISVTEKRAAAVKDAARPLGATALDNDERNLWDIAIAGAHIGQVRHDPRARVWLAKARGESTVGDLDGCLRFVVGRR